MWCSSALAKGGGRSSLWMVLGGDFLLGGQPGLSSTPGFLLRKPDESEPSLEYIGLAPHAWLRHGARTSLLQDNCSRYSLNKCDAWVTVAFARIAAATMAASVNMVSVAPALRASFMCISMQ